jgi:hypothetical protein
MANTTIAIKKSATVSSIPSTLEFGELAINYADGKLYYKNVNSSIVEFAPSGGGESNSFGTVNANSTLIVADTPGDILTLVAGIGIAIEGDAVTDTITISATSTVTTVEVAAAFDKANSANVLAFNTGIGANAFTSATIAGANAAVGAGANTVGTAAFDKANSANVVGSSAFDKANSANVLAYDSGIIGSSAFDKANTGNIVASLAFDKANTANVLAYDSGIIGSSAFDKANTANVLAYDSGIIGSSAFDKANSAEVIAIAGFNKANDANVLAFNTGIGANAFTSATIAGANTAVGAGANTVGSAAFNKANSANVIGSAAFDKANTANVLAYDSGIIGSAAFDKANSANVLAFNTGVGANAFTSATIAGANTAVGAGANTVGLAAFFRANTAETTAIAAFDKANTSGGGIDISTDNTTDGTFYVTLSSLTTGTATTLNVATTKLTFNPSTGTLSATIFNSLSDREYKANIKTLINSLDVVDNLRGVSFNWKDNGQASIGVIAQEIETYVPALVTDNNGIKNVNYDGIIGLLIESIKELKSRIEVLEAEKNGMSE